MARKVSICVIAWTWRHRHSSLDCLINQGSTLDWGDCLLFKLLLCAIIKLETWCCWSTIFENNKTQNFLSLVENCDIKLEILNKSFNSQKFLSLQCSLPISRFSISWTSLIRGTPMSPNTALAPLNTTPIMKATHNLKLSLFFISGESVPVTKTPLPNHKNQIFSLKEHSRHVLFCGTHVLQTRYYGNQKVRAVVIRTGMCHVL